jgi:hypothetical protein
MLLIALLLGRSDAVNPLALGADWLWILLPRF